ncbi:MAG: leucyl aminopeptidase [Desulfobulbaceae bacterium]|nr:leucyl aminopeptidase [Desulfobulbaceae bacterium]
MIFLSNKNPSQFTGDILIYFVREPTKRGAPVCSDVLIQERINHAYQVGDCRGKNEETLLIYPERVFDGVKAKRLLIVGLGKDELNREMFRRAGGVVAQKALAVKAEKLFIVVPEELNFSAEEMTECLCEGLILGSYQFKKYQTKTNEDEKKAEIKKISLYLSQTSSATARKALKRGIAAGNAGNAARDMANEPGNVWTPQAFADYAKKITTGSGLRCKIIEKAEMKRMKMGGILGVNQGSAQAPKLVQLEYRTGKKVPTLLLVGKGLTFDSGGLSLKPSAGMEDMKYDMCGGAAVITAMEVIASEKPKNVDVVALVPATENLPASSAIKPGDIINQYGGKSVEVINTDAEGRLILADALAYGVKKFNPDAIVDLATLTGAVIVGLGNHMTGLLSNNDELAEKVIDSGKKAGEPMWRLPLNDDYRKQIKSEVADIKNIGGKGAGTITAAAFLEEFVGETPWVHLDIAGTAWNYTEKPYIPKKGPVGIGVRSLIELVRDWK